MPSDDDDDREDEEQGEGGNGGPPQFGLMGMSVPLGLLQALQAATGGSPEQREKQLMEREADQLRMRLFVEALGDEQLTTLLWLTEILSQEGQHNYTTFLLRGVLLATAWQRNPIGGGLAGAGD